MGFHPDRHPGIAKLQLGLWRPQTANAELELGDPYRQEGIVRVWWRPGVPAF